MNLGPGIKFWNFSVKTPLEAIFKVPVLVHGCVAAPTLPRRSTPHLQAPQCLCCGLPASGADARSGFSPLSHSRQPRLIPY